MINCTTIIYGPTKTGKTTLIIDLLANLKNHIPVCFIVSGSEDVKPAYAKYLHKSFIYKNVK
jgi:Ni2+-binding GTPase involved in maturation of urease and hydrogenase